MSTPKYVVVPYVWIGVDGEAQANAAIVVAASKLAAVEAVRERVYRDYDAKFWGTAAGPDARPEHAGHDCFYVCRSCDCGYADCAPDERGDGGHETQTIQVVLQPDHARACPTHAAALALLWELTHGYRHASIDLTTSGS